jgi:hypothetical protein
VIENILIGGEDPVREPVVTHELPDVLDRVQLRGARRQRHEGDVVRHLEVLGAVLAGLVEEEDGMGALLDSPGDLGQMQGHGFRVAAGQDQARGLAFAWTDGAEDPGRTGALVTRR